jgi:hypothetical protein
VLGCHQSQSFRDACVVTAELSLSTSLGQNEDGYADLRQSFLPQVCDTPVEFEFAGIRRARHVPQREGPRMKNVSDVAGTAALAICESLLLALNDRNILPEKEIVGILRDAAAAHSNDPGDDGKTDLHTSVAALINGILAGGNSVRRR